MLPERPSGCHAFSLFFRNAAPNCAKNALPARPAFRRATLSEFWSRKSGCVFRAEVRSYSDRNRVHRLDTPAASLRNPPSVAAATYGVVEGVATMMPARKNVSAADSRQKGQKACSMNACT